MKKIDQNVKLLQLSNQQFMKFASMKFLPCSFLFCVFFHALFNSANAQVYWDGSDDDGDWNNISNWSGSPGGNACVIDPDDYGSNRPPILGSNSSFTPTTITVQNGGTLTISADLSCSDITVTGSGSTVTMTTGTLTPSGTVNITTAGSMTISGGTISAGTQLLQIDGASSSLDIDGGTLTFNTFLLNNKAQVGVTLLDISAGSLTFNGDAEYSEGDNSDLKINRIVVSGGTLTFGGDFNEASGIFVKELDIEVSGGTVIFQGEMELFTSQDVFDQTGGTVKFQNTNTWDNDGTFNSIKGTVEFDGTTSLEGSGSWDFYHVTINSTSVCIQTDPSNINVSGDWMNNGTFTHGSNTVTFDDANAQVITGSSNSMFCSLTIAKTADNITLGVATDIDNVFTFNSTGGGLIIIGDYNLTIGNTGTSEITGDGSGGFVVTNGIGYLRQNGIGSGQRTGTIRFPVGYNASSFRNCMLNNSSGTSDRFDVRVCDDIHEEGTLCSGTDITTDAVSVTWEINESVAGGSDVDITLLWSFGEQLAGFSNTDCRIVHHDGSSWEGTQPFGSAGFPEFGYAQRTTTGISDFSPFSLEDSDEPLPIELLEFSAMIEDGKGVIRWMTASELNNDFFTVEKTLDFKSFNAVGTIYGAGNSNEIHDYQLIDENPYEEVSYYRLKQTDYDGSYSYSQLISVANNSAPTIQAVIYPNPFTDSRLNLVLSGESPGEEIAVQILNGYGKLVYHNVIVGQHGSNNYLIETDNILPRGIYFVQIVTKTEKLSTLKIMNE